MAERQAATAPPAGAGKSRAAQWAALRSVLRSQRRAPPLDPVARDAPLPASFAQQRLWFVERLAGEGSRHNLTVACRLRGALSIESMTRGLDEMAQRHEILRTTLAFVDGQLRQQVHSPAALPLPLLDLGGVHGGEREALARQRAAELARAPFDLRRPPLMRACLLRLADEEHWLILTFHHLAFDGWSFEVFMRELGALYGADIADAASPLPVPRLQYADFAAWQRRWLQGEALAPLLEYWTQKMAGPLPVLRLPSDHPRAPAATRPGASLPLALPQELTLALKQLAAGAGVTPFILLLAAFQTLLYRYTGEEDVIVGSPVANRNRSDIAAMIGPFVNTLALRTRLAGRPGFRELLARVRDVVRDAYAHQDLPFEMLVEALELPRRLETTPLIQVMFAYQNMPLSGWTFPGLCADAWNVDNGAAKFDVTLFMWEKEGCFGGSLEYDAGLFNAVSMKRFLDHFRTLLAGIVANPDESIATLPLLSEADRQLLLADWNDTVIDYPRDMAVHGVFEAQVRRTPDATALSCGDQNLSYAELNRRANRLAHRLRKAGAHAGSLVAVFLEPAPEFIVGVLAILKAGAAYIPLSPTEPEERIVAAMQGVTLAVLLTRRALAPQLRGLDAVRVLVDDDLSASGGEDDDDPALATTAVSLAYVMFTSGSTGVPKGVGVTHRGVVRLVRGANYADLGETEVFLQLAPVAFDASTFEIWGALLNGARLVLPESPRPSLGEIALAIRRHQVTTLWLASGLFELMVDTHLEELGSLRQLLVGGDILSVPHAQRFVRQTPGCRLINCYGPTENTTFSTFYPVGDEELPVGATIPIGRPVSNTQIYVLDSLQQLVPAGVSGEACVAGDGLMQGYLNDPAWARGRLVRNPFCEQPGALLYRTGDRVRHRHDGNLEFIGRTDDQVKIRGFRSEPGGVEAVLRRCPAVASVAVVAREGATGGKRLVAYVVPRSAAAAGVFIAETRRFLRGKLPDHLQPAEFIVLEFLPLTRSGKVDRGALPDSASAARIPADAAAPRDELEQTLMLAFGQVLGIDAIGLEDSFFDRGGHSLLALRLVALLESRLGISLPLVSVFEHSSVAGLAAYLRAHGQSLRQLSGALGRSGQTLVEIKRGEAAPALFMVPGGHGGMAEMTLYARLMSHVARPQPVYGLLARGLDGKEEPHASVAEMAEAYLAAIRRQQPCGPYLLAGECVGGVIAFEMAQQLLAQGQEVALLLLMDTWCPTDAGVRHYLRFQRPLVLARDRLSVMRAALSDLGCVLRDHIRDRPAFQPRRSTLYFLRVALTLMRTAAAWWYRLAGIGRPAAGAERCAAAEANYIKQAMRYRPQPYPGAVRLLLTESNRRMGLARDWQRLAPAGLTEYVVPGNHESYLRDTPEATARQFMACLDGRPPVTPAGTWL